MAKLTVIEKIEQRNRIWGKALGSPPCPDHMGKTVKHYDHSDGLFYRVQCSACGTYQLEMVDTGIPRSWYKQEVK